MVSDPWSRTYWTANRALAAHGLAPLTWGNASGIDRDEGWSRSSRAASPTTQLTAEDIVVLDLDGNVVAGDAPAVDRHADAPRALPRVRGDRRDRAHSLDLERRLGPGAARDTAARNHPRRSVRVSDPADPRADRGRDRRPTTRARPGRRWSKLIAERGPPELPCALVRGHAPFCWAASPAARRSRSPITLEEVARMALLTTLLEPGAAPLQAGGARQAPRAQARTAGLLRSTVTSRRPLPAPRRELR